MSYAEGLPYIPETQAIPVEPNPEPLEQQHMLEFVKAAATPEVRDTLPPLDGLVTIPETTNHDPFAAGKEALEKVCYTHIPRTIEEVLQHFEEVRPLLEAAGLKHLIPFWDTYYAVSKEVQVGIANNKYKRPQDVMRTMPIFYSLAIHPLSAYTQNQPKSMAPIWEYLIYSEQIKKASPVTQFALPMIAHIVNDLGQALYTSGVTEAYRDDFFEVKNELKKVAYDMADTLVPLKSKAMQRAVIDPALTLIHHYRKYAWRQGMALLANEHSIHTLRQDASEDEIAAFKKRRNKKHDAKVERTQKKANRHGRMMHYVANVGIRGVQMSDNALDRLRVKQAA